jgi:hypothetical protein
LHPELARLSNVFPSIEFYVAPHDGVGKAEILLNMPPDELGIYITERAKASTIWQDTCPKVYAILATLSPQEIGEAYQEGNLLLKLLVGSHMHFEFHPSYIPIMCEAVHQQAREGYRF